MKPVFKVGDEVWVADTPPVVGKVVEIDSHPFEYDMLLVRSLGAAGEFDRWVSSRLARKRD